MVPRNKSFPNRLLHAASQSWFALSLGRPLSPLAAVGNSCGVVSYPPRAARRPSEFAPRSEHRAGSSLLLVVRQGMRPTTIGMAAGLVAAFSLTRFHPATLLYAVRPADPATVWR